MKQAVILVGGKGTRLGSLSIDMPKPMMFVSGRPFVLLIIEEIARYGFTDIILLCGHLGDKITSEFEGLKVRNAHIRCFVEEHAMGTAGALMQLSNVLDEEFLLFNGDSFFDFNFLDLISIAFNKEYVGKVALRSLQDTGRYGAVVLDGDRILSFSEKVSSGPGVINGGVYLLTKKVLDYINQIPCSLEGDVLPKLASEGLLFGRSYAGYFVDIGIPQDLKRAQSEIPMLSRPAIFFDRNWLLNFDNDHTHRIENFKWMPGAIEAIKLLNDAGWLVFVVTNQSGIARGYYVLEDLFFLYSCMQRCLADYGAHIDNYYCPHHPDGVVKGFALGRDCRKSSLGMFQMALEEWPAINVSSCVLIGDKVSDLQAAETVGIASVFFNGDNLLDVVKKIINQIETKSIKELI